MIIIGTLETWAYYNSQLDYNPAKRVKLHVVAGEKTLCGRNGRAMETMEVKSWWLDVPYLERCEKCNQAQHRKEVAAIKAGLLAD